MPFPFLLVEKNGSVRSKMVGEGFDAAVTSRTDCWVLKTYSPRNAH